MTSDGINLSNKKIDSQNQDSDIKPNTSGTARTNCNNDKSTNGGHHAEMGENSSYWRLRYEKLQDDYDRLQKINQNLEDKLLKVVESYERKREELEADSEHVKSTLMADVNKLSSKLVDARIKLHDYEEKEILHASECGSPCHKMPNAAAGYSVKSKTSEIAQKDMIYDPNLV